MNIQQYVELARAILDGEVFKRDWNLDTDGNQVYMDLNRDIVGFPKSSDEELSIKAYVLERHAAGTNIVTGIDLYSLGPESFVTQIKSNIAIKGTVDSPNLNKDVTITYGTKSSGNGTVKTAVLNSNYTYVGNEVKYTKDGRDFTANKLFEFVVPNEELSEDTGNDAPKIQVWGSKEDGFKLSFDGSDLSSMVNAGGDAYGSVKNATPIVTFEFDIEGIKEIREQISHLEDETSGIVHGRHGGVPYCGWGVFFS